MIRAAGFLAVLALLAWALRRSHEPVAARYPDELELADYV